MESLEQIKKKIANAHDLQSVVTAMKVLATINMRQHERAVSAFFRYSQTIEMGVQVMLRNKPQDVELVHPLPNNRVLALVFGSGQGLAGQFNEQIAAYAIRQMDALGIAPEDRTVVALSEHVTARLLATGQPVREFYGIPGSLPALNRLSQEILIRTERIREAEDIGRIVLYYHRPVSGSRYRPYGLPLLPINPDWLDNLAARPWPSRVLPQIYQDWEQLFSSLIRHDLYVSLNRAFVESLVSENASRLLSMQAAEKNIADRLEELNLQFNHQRQSAITEELLDIVAGFEALMGEDPRQPENDLERTAV